MKLKYALFGLGAIVTIVVSGALFSPSAAAAGVPDAQAFANSYCPANPYVEDKIADYMWITNTAGGNNLSVVEGGSQIVPININFYATYCAYWPPGYTNGAHWMGVVDQSNGADRLRSAPDQIYYGDKTTPDGTRSTWGTATYGASLDVSGWGTGWHDVCTTFATTTTRPKVTFDPSWSACFSIYLNRIYPWNTDGTSQVGVDHTPNVSSWDALPGQTVTWNHGIWNNTQYGTDQITAAINRSGFSGADAWLNGNQWPWWPGAKFSLGPWGNYWFGNNTANYNDDTYFKHVITQDDVGAGFTKAQICQSVSWGPWSQATGGAWKGASPACVNVPYRFTLTTRVDMATDATEPGTAIAPISPYIMNAGPTKSYDGTAWQVSKFILTPGKPIPGAASNQSSPCAAYGSCTSMGTGNGTYDPGDSLVGQIASYTVEDLPIGSRVCFALSVTKYDQTQTSGTRWYDGQPTCVMVGKKPKVQVLGSDVATRAGINVSLTQKTTGVYGSWVEYGAFSVGPNVNFATGAGLSSTPSAQPNNAQVSWSKLTFANVNASGTPKYGMYYGSPSGFRQLPNIAQYFGAISNTAPFNGDKTSANTFQTGGAVQVRTASGPLTIHQDTLPQGRSVVIVSNDTVTIDGDQLYKDDVPYTSVTQLPQLVIIAKNINITGATKQVDGWLIATDSTGGTINTCSDGPVSLTGNDCNNTLTIHGPVEARQLLLRRTAGSGVGQPASGDPAELINLRADTYLWAQLVASGAGKAQTVYTTELPPRF